LHGDYCGGDNNSGDGCEGYPTAWPGDADGVEQDASCRSRPDFAAYAADKRWRVERPGVAADGGTHVIDAETMVLISNAVLGNVAQCFATHADVAAQTANARGRPSSSA
jgi:hypothetical protein